MGSCSRIFRFQRPLIHFTLIVMARFRYKAREASGVIVGGDIDAGDSWLARKEVSKLGLVVLEVHRKSLFFGLSGDFRESLSLRHPVSLEERLAFISHLEIGISVGIPVVGVLELAFQDVRHVGFRESIRSVKEQVTQGASLTDAFARHPAFFDKTFVSLVRTGELSGELDRVLGRLFRITEQEAENRARVKSAMFYPKIVIVFLVLVSSVVVGFVIPRIKGFLGTFGQDLPPITRFVVGISEAVTHYGYVLLPLIALGAWFWSKIAKNERCAWVFDRWKLKAPLLGPLFLQLELCSLCVVLEVLLESGIPLLDALFTAASAQGNRVIKAELEHIQNEVRSGSSLRRAMSGRAVFPTGFSSVVSIGEDSGRIPEVLKRLGRHYQLQADYRLSNLPKLIEPALLAVIFVFTLVLALAVFLPIWKLSSALPKS